MGFRGVRRLKNLKKDVTKITKIISAGRCYLYGLGKSWD